MFASTVFVSYSFHVSIIRLFTLRKKQIHGGRAFADGNSAPCTHARTHTRTHAHTHARTHVHTHMHGVHWIGRWESVRQAGRGCEGAMKDGWWEGGSKGRVGGMEGTRGGRVEAVMRGRGS